MRLLSALILAAVASGCLSPGDGGSAENRSKALAECQSGTPAQTDSCLQLNAVAGRDPALCARIGYPEGRDRCYRLAASASADESACEKILDSAAKDRCYFDVGAYAKPSACGEITDSDGKALCTAISSKDESKCAGFGKDRALCAAAALADPAKCDGMDAADRMMCVTLVASGGAGQEACDSLADRQEWTACMLSSARL